jgi:CRISPR-associated protein Cas2
VLVLSACPAGLRGHLTRWLLEISPGVFVGMVTARVRELMWERVVELSKDGRAIMVHSARNEQRLDFRVHRHNWQPVDVDGLHLMRRPSDPSATRLAVRAGWSRASHARRAKRT